MDAADEQILTIVTYVGCGVSSLFLGITVVTYTVFELRLPTTNTMPPLEVL